MSHFTSAPSGGEAGEYEFEFDYNVADMRATFDAAKHGTPLTGPNAGGGGGGSLTPSFSLHHFSDDQLNGMSSQMENKQFKFCV